MQNDLLTRHKVDYFPKLEKDIGTTDDSIAWAEKKLDHKLTADKDKVQRKRSLADRFDPLEVAYPAAAGLEEDEDTANTLQSAHLAEWLSKNAGAADHHHHDPYHLD